MDTLQFEARKREHIRHSLDSAHQAKGMSGLDQIRLVHEALPELDFDQIDLKTKFLEFSLKTPFYVAGMTAGHEDASQINRTLAVACQERGWAMGVGSQRRDLESRDGISLDSWKKLREEAPDLILLANLGISQVIHAKLSEVKRVVDTLKAQALVVHTNVLQEAFQPEGTPLFRGGLKALQECCKNVGVPVILKETGCGFSKQTLNRLAPLGLAAVDVSGLGGTHWGRIEGARATQNSLQANAALTFANWGEPTAESVLNAAEAFPNQKGCHTEIWASGGVRSGLDAAKLIALGAHRVGYAKPALEAALLGSDSLNQWMETQEFELKVALFCTGSKSSQDLRRKENVWKTNGI